MSDLGMECEWRVLDAPAEFFQVTKRIHNALQGAEVTWSDAEAETWRATNRLNARLLDDSWDYVVVHDAQPAALLAAFEMEAGKRPRGRWIWRCHIDLTTARENLLSFMAPYIEMYDAGIFTLAAYVPDGLRLDRIMVAPPAIDPLTAKNLPVEKVVVRAVLQRFGVDPARPLAVQVSRFDPWKDPLGVIDAYRLAKTEVRGLQLALIASMADDDPEGWEWYERTMAYAGDDQDIHVLTNIDGVEAHEVNCFQRAADVVIQKSTREGFGLVVSEALWKERPVVAGNAGGIPLQVIDGDTGLLVDSIDGCAGGLVRYLRHPEERRAAGRAGRELVRERFLITRYLRDYLSLFAQLGRRRVDVEEPVPLSAAAV
jgi:trehalose synthase